MRLTRAQLRNDLTTLEAQHKVDTAVIGKLLAEVKRLTLEREPTVAEWLALAHRAEQAEAKLGELQAIYDLEQARLARFMQQHPHIFETDGGEAA